MQTREKTTLETLIAASALACAAASLGANIQGGYISEHISKKPETYHGGIVIPIPTDADKLIICSLGLLTIYRNLRRNE